MITALMPIEREHWHRFEDQVECSWDHNYETITSRRVHLQHLTFVVLKHTPKGVWLHCMYHLGPSPPSFEDTHPSSRRWVSKTAHKRFAYPTREQALESFKRRKLRQIKLVKAQLQQAEKALLLAQNPEEAMRGAYLWL